MKKIIGLGSPIIDEIAFVDEAFIDSIEGDKGGMELVDDPGIETLKSRLNQDFQKTAGGSAGNTAFALARLGTQAGFLGKIGNCDSGTYYKKAFSELGGITDSFKVGTSENGKCLSLVTPDGQRTMRTSLGAAISLGPEELSNQDFAPYDHVHIEGYLIHNRPVLDKALQLARASKCTISFDLASFEIVNQLRDELKFILKEYVDIVFANEDEALAFTQHDIFDAKGSAEILGDFCDTVVIKLGAKGSLIYNGSKSIHTEAQAIDQLVDTTGAGDLWAAGFLHGLSLGKSLEDSAYIGALLGSAVVQVQGSALEPLQWSSILEKVNQL